MGVLFVCTDNFTRSIIAEFCMRDHLQKMNDTSIRVGSAGIRANSDVTRYSKIHFDIMREMNIDISGFERTQFSESFFETYDVVIGMSEVHRDFVKKEYKREILLFNEVYLGSTTPVNIGSPEDDGFETQMKALVRYFYDAMPSVISHLKQ